MTLLVLLFAAAPLMAGPLDRTDAGPRINPATNNMLRVPGVVGMDYQNALATLQQAGLNPRLHTIRRPTDKYAGREGTVVRQLPVAGGMAMLGSSVSITVYAPGGASAPAAAPGDAYGAGGDPGYPQYPSGAVDAGAGQDDSGSLPEPPAAAVDSGAGQTGDDAGQGQPTVTNPYPTVPVDGGQGPAAAPDSAVPASSTAAADQPVAPSAGNAPAPQPVDRPTAPVAPTGNPRIVPHPVPAPRIPPVRGGSPSPPSTGTSGGNAPAPAAPAVPRSGWRMPTVPNGAQRSSAGGAGDAPVSPPPRRNLFNPRAGGL
ncbi:MAG: PASTA domain-containing protein [Gammaproteobacteria bacterium]